MSKPGDFIHPGYVEGERLTLVMCPTCEASGFVPIKGPWRCDACGTVFERRVRCERENGIYTIDGVTSGAAVTPGDGDNKC